MPHKIQLNELTQVSNNEKNFLSALNDNLQRIQKALDETVSRLGQTPNQMEEVLDMNGHRIVNVGRAQGPLDVVTKQDIQSIIDDAEQAINSLESIVEDAKEALVLYGQEIITEAVIAKDDAVDAKNTAVSAKDTAVASANLAEAARAFIAEDPGFIAVSADLTGDNKIGTVADNLEGSDTIGTVAANISNVEAVGSNISNVNAVAGNATNINAVNANKTNIDTVATNVNEVVQAGSNIDAIVAVNSNETNINAVNSNKENINTVAGNIQDVVQAGSNISAIQAVNANKNNIDTVAASIADVSAVAGNISNVNSVANNATNINAVNANKTNIDTVAGNIDVIEEIAPAAPTLAVVGQHIGDVETVADDLEGADNIGTVASNISSVNAVANNISNVNAVADNATNINAVNANKANIDAVVANASNITAVANNATNINAVNANKANIDTVVANLDDISDVADNATDITAVANNISNVNAVADNATNINAVAGNAANINAVNANKVNIDTVAENIDDILEVPQYAELAKDWAIKSTPVEIITGTRTVSHLYAWRNTFGGDAEEIVYTLSDYEMPEQGTRIIHDPLFPIWLYKANGDIYKITTAEGTSNFYLLSCNSDQELFSIAEFSSEVFAKILVRSPENDITTQITVQTETHYNSSKTHAKESREYNIRSKSIAEGADSEVSSFGILHSCRKWAEIAQDAAETVDDFGGATSTTDGHKGLVIAPLAGDQNKFLKGDGTWGDAGASYTEGTGIDITGTTISVTQAISDGAAAGSTAVQPQAISDMASMTWVGQQGYQNASQVDSAITSKGYITGITSQMISAALGYTPYSSSNPSGYITQAVDDSSTTSTTVGWSASKLNTTIGNVESLINAL